MGEWCKDIGSVHGGDDKCFGNSGDREKDVQDVVALLELKGL
jgi:hypothetical protein